MVLTSSLQMHCPWNSCFHPKRRNQIHNVEDGPIHQTSQESIATRVSVDAPEPFAAKSKWSRDIVRRLSLRKDSVSSQLHGSEHGVKASSTKGSLYKTRERTYIRTLFHVQDNKISLKLFGSKRGVREEQERQEQMGFYVIHPCSIFR